MLTPSDSVPLKFHGDKVFRRFGNNRIGVSLSLLLVFYAHFGLVSARGVGDGGSIDDSGGNLDHVGGDVADSTGDVSDSNGEIGDGGLIFGEHDGSGEIVRHQGGRVKKRGTDCLYNRRRRRKSFSLEFNSNNQ